MWLVPMYHSGTPPFVSTHDGCLQTEYPFVYAPGLHNISFGMYSITQKVFRSGASDYIFCTCGVVDYRESENVTPARVKLIALLT